MTATDSLAYLTPDLPGVGGVLKSSNEDFLVEEQPLYEPCGEGEHVYLFIEKNGLTTTEAVHRIARGFHMHRRNIGYAGLKDKHAVTRQHLSLWLPGVDEERILEGVQRINTQQKKLKILWQERHTNKLKRGHHGGNRFVIRVRDVEPTHVVRAKKVLDVLAKRGVPNYVGDQRFGYRQNSHRTGRALLLGENRLQRRHQQLAPQHDHQVLARVAGLVVHHVTAGDEKEALVPLEEEAARIRERP